MGMVLLVHPDDEAGITAEVADAARRNGWDILVFRPEEPGQAPQPGRAVLVDAGMVRQGFGKGGDCRLPRKAGG